MSEPTVQQTERDLLFRIRTEGVKVAYETALAICLDPKSTSPARATASATLFRVAGFFDHRVAAGTEKEPHEMTSEELREAIREAEGRAAKPAPGLFD